MSAEEDARSQLSAATGERGLDWIGSDWRGRLAEREEGGARTLGEPAHRGRRGAAIWVNEMSSERASSEF